MVDLSDVLKTDLLEFLNKVIDLQMIKENSHTDDSFTTMI